MGCILTNYISVYTYLNIKCFFEEKKIIHQWCREMNGKKPVMIKKKKKQAEHEIIQVRGDCV